MNFSWFFYCKITLYSIDYTHYSVLTAQQY